MAKIGTAILEIRTDTGHFSSGLAGAKNDVRAFGVEVQATSKLVSSIGKVMATAFTATALVAAGKQVLDFAGEVTDLSKQLKVSTTTVQQWKATFGAAGVDLGTVAKASEQLTLKLVGGDKSAVAALEKMGLSVEALRAMKPEERFVAVADAVGNIQDAGEQLYASKTLFGKGGPELLAALDGHLGETIDRITELGLVIDEQTIAAADDFGDQLGFMGQQLLAIVATVVGPLLPALSSLGNALIWLGRDVIGPIVNGAIKGTMTALYSLAAGIDRFLVGVLKGAQQIPILGKHLGFTADAIAWLEKDAAGAEAQLAALWTETDKAGTSAAAATPKLLGLGGASEDAGKKAKKHAEELAQLYTRIQLLNEANAAGVVARPTYDAGGGELPEVTRLKDYLAQLARVREIEKQLAANRGTGLAFLTEIAKVQAVEESIGRRGAAGITELGQALEVAAPKARTLADSLRSLASGNLRSVFKDIGGFFKNGIGEIGTGFLRGLGNAMLGGLSGMLTAGVGALAKGIGSLFGKIFGSEEKKINPVRQAYIDAAGGLAALNQRAMEATGSIALVQRLLDAKNPREYEAAIRALNDAFAEQEARVADVDEAIGGLEEAVAAAGGTMPEHLRPMIERLLEIGNLTDEQRKRLTELANGGEPDFKRLQKVAEDYGITLDGLGPAFQQADITDTAMQIVKDFEAITNAGGDAGGVLLGMSDEVSELVQNAIKYGAALPEAMRPILENLAAAGKLTDENGEKIEDLSGLNFEETPLERSTSAIVEAIDRLGELLGGLPGIAREAAGGISRALDSIPDPEITGRVRWDVDAPPDFGIDYPGGRSFEGIPMAAGGFGRVTRATPFIVGEAGAEDFVAGGAGRNLAQDVAGALAPLLAGAGGDLRPVEITFAPTLDGRVLTRSIHRVYDDNAGGMRTEARELLGVS